MYYTLFWINNLERNKLLNLKLTFTIVLRFNVRGK